MADHIVRCMAPPPSLYRVDHRHKRCTAGYASAPHRSGILRLGLYNAASLRSLLVCALPAHPGTSFPTWGRSCSLRAAVATMPWVELLTCGSCQFPYVSPYITAYYIVKSHTHCSRIIQFSDPRLSVFSLPRQGGRGRSPREARGNRELHGPDAAPGSVQDPGNTF